MRTSCQRIMVCSTLLSCFCTLGRAKTLDQDQLASGQHAAHGADSAEPLWPRGRQHTLSVRHARTPYPNPTRSPGPPAQPSMWLFHFSPVPPGGTARPTVRPPPAWASGQRCTAAGWARRKRHPPSGAASRRRAQRPRPTCPTQHRRPCAPPRAAECLSEGGAGR